VINVSPQDELDDLTGELAERGVTTLLLDGAQVSDAAGFFAATGTQIFGGAAIANWDSFADSLLNHVVDLGGTETAFVWANAQNMLRGDLAELLVAADVLTHTARRLPTPGPVLTLYLTGTGDEFA
jgi:hypothetical protein